MNCQKCNTNNSNDAAFCNKCGAKLAKNQVATLAPTKPKMPVGGKVKLSPKFKKIGIVVGIVVIVILTGWFAFKKISFMLKHDYNVKIPSDTSKGWLDMQRKPTEQPNTSKPEDKPKEQPPEDKPQDTGETKEYTGFDSLPIPPNIQLSQEYDVDDAGGLRVTWDTKEGESATSEGVMDFYEEELTKMGWLVQSRDRDNNQMELYHDESGDFMRIWIYYEGTDLDGADELPLTYIMDFQPQGAEILPVMHQ